VHAALAMRLKIMGRTLVGVYRCVVWHLCHCSTTDYTKV
jgi:hypothetical protein